MRWLSKGRSLARVSELRESLQRFLLEKQSPLAAHFSDTEWVTKLAHWCDIFNLLKELSLSLQGRTTTVFKSAEKVAAFKAKLELWEPRVNIGIFVMFQTLVEILKETEPGPSFSQLVHDHLSQLSKEFEHYFRTTKDPRTGKEWIHYPFVNKPGELTLSVLEEDPLLEMANDGALKSMFETTSNLLTFRIKVKVEYPEIATKVLKSLLPFRTSYLCEAGFSAVTATKTRLWSRRDIKQHASGVTVSHHPQMGPSSCRKTSSGLPLILHFGELHNYFIIYYHVIIIKCTINVMRLNHPETMSPPVRGKIVSHETGPWCQKCWGALV